MFDMQSKQFIYIYITISKIRHVNVFVRTGLFTYVCLYWIIWISEPAIAWHLCNVIIASRAVLDKILSTDYLPRLCVSNTFMINKPTNTIVHVILPNTNILSVKYMKKKNYFYLDSRNNNLSIQQPEQTCKDLICVLNASDEDESTEIALNWTRPVDQ